MLILFTCFIKNTMKSALYSKGGGPLDISKQSSLYTITAPKSYNRLLDLNFSSLQSLQQSLSLFDNQHCSLILLLAEMS